MLPDITQVIASVLAAPGQIKTVREATAEALARRPGAFGFTTEYALRRYRERRRARAAVNANSAHNAVNAPDSDRRAGADRGPLREALWNEFSALVDQRLRSHPGEDDFSAVEYVLSNEAPSRYYLSPLYAEKLFYRWNRRRRKSRSFPTHPEKLCPL